MDVASRLQGGAYGAHPPVHHVRGGHHIRPGPGMGQGLLHQDRDRLVVEHIAGGIDEAILAVGGEGVEGDVGARCAKPSGL